MGIVFALSKYISSDCLVFYRLNDERDRGKNMIYDIIQQNFIAIAIVVFLILFIIINNNFDYITEGLFLASAVCVIIFIAEEAWESQLALSNTYEPMRVWLSALGYSLRPMTAYFVVLVAWKKSIRWKLLISLPVVLNAMVAFSAVFGNWSFSYTADNQFVRGPLGYTPFITAAFYIIMLLGATLAARKKGNRMEVVTILAIIVLVILSTTMESAYHFRAIQGGAGGISLTFYYLYLHTNQNNRDPLTGALVRRRFYQDADKYRGLLTAVISLDLNNLKHLNDQFGHIAGDKALITMTEVVSNCINKNASIYRTGGDEFMILCYKMGNAEVEALIERIRTAMKQTEYSCAIGYAPFHQMDGLERVCQMADTAMYENKKEMKANAQT